MSITVKIIILFLSYKHEKEDDLTHPLTNTYLLINFFTRSTTFDTEKPYSFIMVSPGAEAPN